MYAQADDSTIAEDYLAAGEEVTLAGPWPRFLARMVDLYLLILPVGFLFGMLFPSFALSLTATPALELVIGILLLPFVMVADALITAAFGRSIGKAIVGLKVVDDKLEKPSVELALHRNLLAYVRGFFLGIPLLVLVGYAKAHADVKEGGTTSWDDATGTRVIEHGFHPARAAVAGLIAICLNIGGRLI